MKTFEDDKLNVTQNVKVVFQRIENIVGKEENAGYQHFLLFPQCFQKAYSSNVSKVVIVWERVNALPLASLSPYISIVYLLSLMKPTLSCSPTLKKINKNVDGHPSTKNNDKRLFQE